VQRASLDQAENGRKSSREPRRGEAMKGFIFAQPKPTAAVIEERATARFEVQPPLFDCREVRKDARLGARAARKQPPELNFQVTIRNAA
jgi:hypothetical protein